MNRLIKGSGMIAELLVSGDYVPIFCAKDCTLSVSHYKAIKKYGPSDIHRTSFLTSVL